MSKCGHQSHNISSKKLKLTQKLLSWDCPVIAPSDINLTLQWRHNGWDGILNHQPQDYLLNRLFRRSSRRSSKRTSKLLVTGLCAGNSPVTSEFPAQRASDVENVSIWWRPHEQCSAEQITGVEHKHFSKFSTISASWRSCGCLVTWFCYQLITKPGNKPVAPPSAGPYSVEGVSKMWSISSIIFFTIYGAVCYQLIHIFWEFKKYLYWYFISTHQKYEV